MIRDVRANPADQALFDDLLLYLTEEDEAALRAGLSVVFDLILGTSDAAVYPEVAPLFASIIDPDRVFDEPTIASTANLPLVTHLALVLREAVELDEEGVVIDLLARGLVPDASGETPMGVLGRVIRQINRAQPGSTESMTPADLEHLYGVLADFIRDDLEGAERVFILIDERKGE